MTWRWLLLSQIRAARHVLDVEGGEWICEVTLPFVQLGQRAAAHDVPLRPDATLKGIGKAAEWKVVAACRRVAPVTRWRQASVTHDTRLLMVGVCVACNAHTAHAYEVQPPQPSRNNASSPPLPPPPCCLCSHTQPTLHGWARRRTYPINTTHKQY